jgi:hypothetical protein
LQRPEAKAAGNKQAAKKEEKVVDGDLKSMSKSQAQLITAKQRR